MAKVKGKDCFFAITTSEYTSDTPPDYEGATPADWDDISGVSNEVTLSIDAKTVDASSYGDDFDQFEVMTYNWKVDATFYYTPGNATDTDVSLQKGILDLLKRGISFHPNGKKTTSPDSSQPEYSGRVLISSVSMGPDRAGLTSLRVSLQGDGALTRTVA